MLLLSFHVVVVVVVHVVVPVVIHVVVLVVDVQAPTVDPCNSTCSPIQRCTISQPVNKPFCTANCSNNGPCPSDSKCTAAKKDPTCSSACETLPKCVPIHVSPTTSSTKISRIPMSTESASTTLPAPVEVMTSQRTITHSTSHHTAFSTAASSRVSSVSLPRSPQSTSPATSKALEPSTATQSTFPAFTSQAVGTTLDTVPSTLTSQEATTAAQTSTETKTLTSSATSRPTASSTSNIPKTPITSFKTKSTELTANFTVAPSTRNRSIATSGPTNTSRGRTFAGMCLFHGFSTFDEIQDVRLKREKAQFSMSKLWTPHMLWLLPQLLYWSVPGIRMLCTQ